LFQIKFGPFPSGKVFILTVDGTHFRIKEPRSDPSSKWYSHKFNSPGLAYELAISVYENRICWTSGQFPASVHDITIYCGGLLAMMLPGCKSIGDSRYAGETDNITVIRPGDSTGMKKFKEAARARQENVNGRLKEFAILENRWPYHRDKHAMVYPSPEVLQNPNTCVFRLPQPPLDAADGRFHTNGSTPNQCFLALGLESSGHFP
jgi:hypothetical protein